MKARTLVGIIEVIALLLCLGLGLLWIRNPNGPYEPYLAVAGLVFAGTEIYRRYDRRTLNSALIKVQETGKNFRMVDCEFQMGNSPRPILETKAPNTRMEGTKVTAIVSNSWKFFASLVVLAVISIVLVYFFLISA